MKVESSTYLKKPLWVPFKKYWIAAPSLCILSPAEGPNTFRPTAPSSTSL